MSSNLVPGAVKCTKNSAKGNRNLLIKPIHLFFSSFSNYEPLWTAMDPSKSYFVAWRALIFVEKSRFFRFFFFKKKKVACSVSCFYREAAVYLLGVKFTINIAFHPKSFRNHQSDFKIMLSDIRCHVVRQSIYELFYVSGVCVCAFLFSYVNAKRYASLMWHLFASAKYHFIITNLFVSCFRCVTDSEALQ